MADEAENAEDFIPTIDTMLGTGVGEDRDILEKGKVSPDDGDKEKDIPFKGEGDPPKKGEEEEEEEVESSEEETKETAKEKVTTLLKSFSSEDLEEGNKELRSKLLSQYKGEKFDENGNILDKEGNILKTSEHIFEELNEGEGEGGETEKSVADKLHEESEYEFVDEKGNAKIYSDDLKGIQEFSKDTANAELENLKNQFFGQNEELVEISKHLLTGGTLENYNSSIDYSKVDFEKLSEDEKLAYITKSFEVRDFSKERIADMVKRIKDSNTIDGEVKYAIEDLEKYQKNIEETRNRKIQELTKQREEEDVAYWKEVENTLEIGKLNGIEVAKEDKDNFLKYLTTPVNSKGQSQAELDRNSEKIDAQLLFEYFRFKKYDFNTFINNRVNTKKVNSLKQQLFNSAKIKEGNFKNTNNDNKDSNKSKVVSINDLLG